MKSVEGLARWPLLLGAVLLFVAALWEASHETEANESVSIVALALGCTLLGAWLWSLAIDAERRYHDRHQQE